MSVPQRTAMTPGRRWLRRALIGVAVLAALLAALAAWIVATFDPNAYKPRLIELVQQRYQRTLDLDGDIRISWFPSIGAEVGGVSLSERGNSIEFAGADRLRVSLALLPLLRGQVVVDDLLISRPRATLVERKDGSRNFDDLLAAPDADGKPDQPGADDGSGRPPRLDIAGIVIDKGRLTLRNERTGQVVTLSALDFSAGRLGGSRSEPFSLSAAVQAVEPRLDFRLQAKGQLLADLEQRRYGAIGLSAAVTGSSGNLPLEVRLELARLLTGERVLEIEKLKLNVRQGDAGQLRLIEANLPSLRARGDAFAGAALGVVIDQKSADTSLNIRIGAPLQGRMAESGLLPARIEAPEIKADLEGRLAGRTVQGTARGQFVADIAAGRYALSRLALKGTLYGLDAPVRDVTVTLDGAGAYDQSQQAMTASASGRLHDSTIRASIARDGAKAPFVFDLEADQFDLDRYRPAAAAPGARPAPAAAAAPAAPGKVAPGADKPIDFAFLDGLAAAGAVRIGALKANNLRANNVRIDVKAADGRLDLAPIAASLYSGRLAGALTLEQARPPRIALRQTLTGVQVGPLLNDLASLDLIEGRGDIRIDVTTRGSSADAFKRALAGTASFDIADGALRGVNIAGVLRDARNRLAQLQGREARPAVAGDRTDFSELKASFVLRDGVARNSDLSMRSPLLRAGGEGAIDIGRGSIDYLLRPTIVGTLTGQGGRDARELRGVTVPVRITGPLAKPQYEFELQAMLVDTARQQLQQRATDLLKDRLGIGGKPAEQAPAGKPDAAPSPRDLLKGILGR